MKIKSFMLSAAVLLGWVVQAQAADKVRDELITTTDRTCGIHYLTHGNTVGWYLTEVEGSCPNGLLNGMGQITIRNAFGQVIQSVKGVFVQGYPVKSDYGDITLKTLWLSDTSNQSLIFDLGTEERLNIQYLGKMTATRGSDDSYSPFEACYPVVVLAVTPDLDLFADEAVQQELINSILNRLDSVCPEARQVYLYGSNVDNPKNEDIAFFADINLEVGHIKIRRLPSSPRIRDVLTNPAEASDIPIPKEIRRETGLPVVQITPVKPENQPAPTFQPAKEPEVATPSVLPAQVPLLPEPVVAPESAPEPIPEPLISPKPVAEPQAPMPEIRPTLDDIPALLTAARLLKQPVEGKALVHISRFDATGLALTDKPVALRLKGNNMPLGWGVVQGTFSYTPLQNNADTIGFVQVQSFTPMKEK